MSGEDNSPDFLITAPTLTEQFALRIKDGLDTI